MGKFIDRQEEWNTLQSEYEREGASLVIVYGRRRVGKTTLISEFIKGKKALFFLASEEPESQNRRNFQEKAAEFTGDPVLKDAGNLSWDMIFRLITQICYAGKPIIVMDEFQYIGKANPAFPSVFQRIWEENLKTKSVMVILCGSLISMMVSQTLSYNSPLYGRRTAQICLKQIPYRYYREFFPDKEETERIKTYAVTGGIPKYILSFAAQSDIYEEIRRNILNRSGYLYDEPFFLLQQEVTQIGSYFSVIKAIAAGNRKLSAIASVLETPATGLTKYLKTLEDMDILEREVPVTEEHPEKSKKGLYRITDNYLRFWFLFIYPDRSFIESGNSGIVLEKIKGSFIKNHCAFVYEDICREKMWELNARKTWPFFFTKVGRYWNGKEEIDIAAVDPDGNNLILGECKFWERPADLRVLRELERKTPAVEWRKASRKVWYILFSVSGFTPEVETEAKRRTDLILES